MNTLNAVINNSPQKRRSKGYYTISKYIFFVTLLFVAFLAGCKKDDFTGEVIGLCPTVTTDPMDKAVDVPLNKVIKATFNTIMEASTINSSTFIIKQGVNQISGKVSPTPDGALFTFDPDNDLLPFTTYTGTIRNTVTDTLHTAMIENYVWSFTTIPVLSVFANPTIGGTATGAGAFAQNSLVTVNAVPEDGYTFINWSESENGPSVSNSSSYQFKMNGNRTLVANFEPTPIGEFAVVLSANPTAGGTTIGAGSFDAGSSVTVSARVNAGYTFVDWTENGVRVSTSSNIQFMLNADRNFVANFRAIPASEFAVLLTSSPAAGGTTDGEGSYASGTSVTISSVPNTGYTFVNWTDLASGTVVSASPNYTFALSSNRALVANFLLNTYTLTVNAVNGSVSKAPDQAAYNHGSSVVLTATPAAGYVFSSWSGDATGTTNPLTVSMTRNRTITANFTAIPANQFTLTVTAVNGSVAKVADQPSYESGTNVVLTATPAAGYVFSSWSGDATGTTNPLTVSMTSNKAITANFTAIPVTQYTLTVTAVNGSVTKAPDQPTYASGSNVVLTATPAAGYVFSSWSGDATGTTNPLTVNMTGNKAITANFTAIPPNQFTLTVTAVNGSVTKVADQPTYTSGSDVVLTATPAAGYVFSSWSGDATGTTNPLTVNMNANKAITANFTAIPVIRYTLTVTAVNGSVVKVPNQTTYASGSNVVLTATPATGYVFSSWSGAATGSTNPLTVNMNANKAITANFIAIPTIQYTLAVTAENGSVSKVPNQPTYASGSTVILTATPDAGYVFSSWSGDAVGTSNPLNVHMISNKTITANFTAIPANQYSLTVISENGTVSKSPVQATYISGSNVILTASPAEGYVFSSWSGDASGTTNPLTVNMTGNKSITANFTAIPPNQYTLTVTAVNGSVTKVTNQPTYESGSEVVLTASPAEGYVFSSWSGDATGTTNPLNVSMTSNKSITANFTAIPVIQYTLAVTAVNGSIAKEPNQTTYANGSTVVLTASPAEGYVFSSWSGDASGTTNPLNVSMTSNKSIMANFTAIPVIQYTLAVTAVNGSVAKVPNQTTYASGSEVALTASPATGYVFSSWSGDATGTSNPLTVIMNANKNITANFTQVVTAPLFSSIFGAFGGSAGITNQGLNTVINNGSIGTTAASTLITGFHDGTTGDVYTETPLNKGLVTGRIHTAPPAPGSVASSEIANQALADMNAFYVSISPAGRPNGTILSNDELGDRILFPGTYKSASGTYKITNGNLTLDGQGNSNSVWVFQVPTALTVGIAGPTGARSITLTNGAQAKNVYWYVGTAATINAAGGGIMAGTIISSAGVTFSTAGNVTQTVLNGRALSLVASVTMVNTTINVPTP